MDGIRIELDYAAIEKLEKAVPRAGCAVDHPDGFCPGAADNHLASDIPARCNIAGDQRAGIKLDELPFGVHDLPGSLGVIAFAFKNGLLFRRTVEIQARLQLHGDRCAAGLRRHELRPFQARHPQSSPR